VRHLLAVAARSDTFVPNLRESSSFHQQETRDPRIRALYNIVPQELLPTSQHHPDASADYLRLLWRAGLSDRLGPPPCGGWQHPLHLRSAGTDVLGSIGAYMYRRQVMQLLLRLQEQETFQS
jgi:hypothetical protein